MIVDIHIPCYVDQYFPDTAMNMVKVLKAAGCDVHYNVDQTCCGLPAFYDGFQDHCKDAGTKLIKEFQNDRYVVSCGSACADMIRNQYAMMFHNSLLHNEYKALKGKFFEFTGFLTEVLGVLDFGARLEGTAVYLDACTSACGSGISDSPRRLLGKVAGLSLIEVADNTTCCGWGGTLAGNHEKLAVEIARQKLAQIRATGAEYVVSGEAGCLMHLKGTFEKSRQVRGGDAGGTERQEPKWRFMHIADVLATGLGG